MYFRDFREYLMALEEFGKLKRIKKTVDREWEISTIARCMFQGLPEPQRFGLFLKMLRGLICLWLLQCSGHRGKYMHLLWGVRPKRFMIAGVMH